MATWKQLIEDAFVRGDTWDDVVYCTLNSLAMTAEFDDGYGSTEGEPFTLWTKNRVYFPLVYDGAEWVGSVPRNPCDEAMAHKGGY